MKGYKYIWILIIIYIVCSARTCNESEEATEVQKEHYTINLLNSVKHVFTSDSLSDHFLRAYEITAAEKLTDFADYIKIISDTTLDRRFRQHAAELCRDLFVSDEIELTDWSKYYPAKGINNLEHLISYTLTEGASFWIKPVRNNIIEQFTSKNDSALTGKIVFNYKPLPLYNQDKSEISTGRLVIDIYLLKKTRSFGEDLFRVWEVYLGDIYEYHEE